MILVTTAKEMGAKVKTALDKQLSVLPRKEIAAVALENSLTVYFEDEPTALDFINAHGPEHYIACV